MLSRHNFLPMGDGNMLVTELEDDPVEGLSAMRRMMSEATPPKDHSTVLFWHPNGSRHLGGSPEEVEQRNKHYLWLGMPTEWRASYKVSQGIVVDLDSLETNDFGQAMDWLLTKWKELDNG